MSNITKNFKQKSLLRGMADGGLVGRAVKSREQQMQESLGNWKAASAPAPGQPDFRNVQAKVTSTELAPGERPKSALQKFFGMADGGQVQPIRQNALTQVTQPGSGGSTQGVTAQSGVFKSTTGGVNAYSDANGAAAGATKFASNPNGPGLSTITAGVPSPIVRPPEPAPAPTIGSQIETLLKQQQAQQQPAAVPPAASTSLRSPMAPPPVPGLPPPVFAEAPAIPPPPWMAGMADGGSPLRSKTAYPNTEYDFARGHGGGVRGPGGPVDDKVGPIMLSDKEYVLPADTVAAVGKKNLDKIRDATHDFDETREARGAAMGMAAGGGVMDRLKNAWSALRPNAAAAPAPVAPAPVAPAPVAPAPVAPAAPVQLGEGTQRLADQVARRPMLPNGAPSSPLNPMHGPGNLPEYRTGNGFRQTPPPGGAASTAAPAVEAGGGASSGLRKLATPMRGLGGAVAGIAGAGQSFADASSGFNEHYKKSLGIEGKSFLGDVAGNTLTTLGNVGDAASFGIAGRLGRGLGNAASGGSFIDGFTGDSARDTFLNGKEAAASATNLEPPVAPSPQFADEANNKHGGRDGQYPGMMENKSGLANSDPRINGSDSERYNALADDAVIGAVGGKAMTKREADGRAAGLQTASGMAPRAERDPLMEALTSALRGGGGGGGYSGPSSQARAINERYDKISSDMASRYSARGQGNLTKRQLELEQMRSGALDADARVRSGLRGQDMQAGTAANANRTNLAAVAERMMASRDAALAAGAKAGADGLENARKVDEQRSEDSVSAASEVAEVFAAGDKEEQARNAELLSTLPPKVQATIENQTAGQQRETYANILRQNEGTQKGALLGRDVGATAQNAGLGAIAGGLARTKGGSGVGKAIDKAIGFIPRIGKPISMLRPAENLARLGPLIGGALGAAATPEIEEFNRYDPIASDENGAAFDAPKDIAQALKYGGWDTYSPFNDDVMTESGRRTKRQTPTEAEAARRLKASLRTGDK